MITIMMITLMGILCMNDVQAKRDFSCLLEAEQPNAPPHLFLPLHLVLVTNKTSSSSIQLPWIDLNLFSHFLIVLTIDHFGL